MFLCSSLTNYQMCSITNSLIIVQRFPKSDLQKHVGFYFFVWNSDHTSGMFDPEFLLTTMFFFSMCVCVLCFGGLYSTISYNVL